MICSWVLGDFFSAMTRPSGVWKTASNPGHLLPRESIADEHWRLDPLAVQHLHDVRGQCLRRISAWSAGFAVAASRDSDNTPRARELWGPVIVDVSRLSQLCEEDQHPARATPIQDLNAGVRT